MCYENLDSNCLKYGRLYSLDDARHACPGGWRLPVPEEVEALRHSIKSDMINKIAATGEWHVRGAHQFNNSTGLNVLPAGRIDSFSFYSRETAAWVNKLDFHQLGIAASFWLDDKMTEEGILHWHLGTPMGERKQGMHRHQISPDEHKFSVRCVCTVQN